MRRPHHRILLATFLCLASIHHLKAATITVTNFNGPDSNLLTHPTGKLLTRGTVRIGSFGFSDTDLRQAFSQNGAATILDAFSQFGNAVSIGFDGLPGLYQNTIQSALESGNAFVGENIYTVITDSPTLEAAAEWLVYRHDQVFLEDPKPIAPALLNASSAGELMVGSFGEYSASVGQIIASPVFTLAAVIPEPSTTVLTILSAMLMVVPRRRGAIFFSMKHCYLILLTLWIAVACSCGNPLFPEQGDQERLAKGSFEALAFRDQLLTGAHEELAALIRQFVKIANRELKMRKRPQVDLAFRISSESLVQHLRGTADNQGAQAFMAFAGKWYGLWEKREVDHHWGLVETMPNLSSKEFDFQAVQFAWIGDGFGWNIVASHRESPNLAFVLGSVYHVDADTKRGVRLHRPHIGIAVDAKRLIWITKGEVFLEEAIELMGHPAYTITGFNYHCDQTSGRCTPSKAFQAVYTRDPDIRPEWISFPFLSLTESQDS